MMKIFTRFLPVFLSLLFILVVTGVQAQPLCKMAVSTTSSGSEGRAIATDAAGNTYVTGDFQGTINFDPSGAAASFNSANNSSAFVAKYNSQGQYQWAFSIGDGNDYTLGYGIAVDVAGNVYVTGVFTGSNIDFDPSAVSATLSTNGTANSFVAKYNTNGQYQWAFNIGGSAVGSGSGIAVDATGSNVYVTGYFSGSSVDFDSAHTNAASQLTSGGGFDAYVAKYNTSGQYQWAFKVGGTASDAGQGIAVDASGNAYVTGHFASVNVDFDPSAGTALFSAASSGDGYVAKYNSSGQYQWAFKIGGTGAAVGNAIATDASGNVYVGGYFTGANVDFDPSAGTALVSSAGSNNGYVAKYNTSGQYQWAFNIKGAGNNPVYGIVADNLGNVYIDGTLNGSGSDFDPSAGTAILNDAGSGDGFVARYNNSGQYQWVSQLGNSSSQQICYAVATDVSNNLYIAGASGGTMDVDPTAHTVNITGGMYGDFFVAAYYFKAWTGATNTDWATTTNWAPNGMPVNTDNVTIVDTTNRPFISSATVATVNNITVNGAAVVSNGGGTLQIAGAINSNRSISSVIGGTIELDGTSAQVIPAASFSADTVNNLTINNAAGVTLNGALSVTNVLNPVNGLFTTNGYLILASTSTRTAQVTAGSTGGGYITGSVTVQRYIPGGSRKYRFLGHPFSVDIPLTQLTDDIDITGTITGSNANNFTTTGSNAASAFSYNEAADDGVTGTNNNAGWVAYTSSNSVGTISTGQGIRVLVRGSKGQAGSLTGGTYTPDPVTLSMSGTLRQGDWIQNLSYTSSTKGWNLVSDPYASDVSWDDITKINVADAVYTYRPALSGGNYGSYVNSSAANGGSNYLQAGSSFFVRSVGASPALAWYEASKVTNTPPNSVFGAGATIHSRLSLTLINDSTLNTDEVVVRFGDNPATDLFDAAYDAENMAGAAQDLYVLDSVGTLYSIFHGSALGFSNTERREVKLGIDNLAAGSYTIRAVTLNPFIGGNTAYIKDAEKSTLTPVTDTTLYHFAVATNTTGLRTRFSIVFNSKPTTIAVLPGKFTVSAYPNPATDVLNISYEGLSSDEPTTIRIVDMSGRTMQTIEAGKQTAGSQRISISGWSKGMYSIQLLNGSNQQTQSIIKH